MNKIHDNFADNAIKIHSGLKESVISIISSVLRMEGMQTLSITGRLKEKKSILDKISRKNYGDPTNQMTDVSAVRIITYFDSDISKISNIIKNLFEVDIDNSLDQISKLGNDKIGYRSVHFVCKLGESRRDIPEYSEISDLKFEIQIRTILQHAWAELAHDRSYKFTGNLPVDISRKINLYAGLLEIADKGFNEIIENINKYSSKITHDEQDEFDKEEINTISIKEFIYRINKKYDLKIVKNTMTEENLSIAVDELKKFGLKLIGDLWILIDNEFIKEIISVQGKFFHFVGFIRDSMIYNDMNGYFQKIGTPFGFVDKKDIALYSKKYGDEKALSILKSYGIYVEDYTPSWEDLTSPEDEDDENS